MPDQKLTDFLTDLAKPENHARLRRYLKSKEDREAVIDESELSGQKAKALKDNDFRKVKEIIGDENPDAEIYLVPMGQQISSL